MRPAIATGRAGALTDGVPLSEAAFLGRASSVSAVATHSDGFLDTDLDALAGAVNVYIPNTIFFAGVGASRSEEVVGVSSTMIVKRYDTVLFGTLGLAPIEGLLITTNISEGNYDPNLTMRHVGRLPNGHFYAGGLSLVDPEFGDTSFALDFDYYFDDSTSLGAGYDDFRDRWELRAERFFTRNWAFGAAAHTDDFSHGFGIEVTWRH